MRFHVAGVGSLGSLVAHHLRKATSATHPILLLYDKRKHALHGPDALHVEKFGSVVTTAGFERETYTANEEPIDSLFLTTRANATIHAIKQLAPRLSANSTVVLVQNGLAVYDRIIETLFRNPNQRPHFIFASTTHVALFQAAGDLPGNLHKLVYPRRRGILEFAIVPDPFGRNFEAGFADAKLHPSERNPRLSDLGNPEEDSYQRYRSLRNTVAALLLADALNARWKPMEHLQLILRRKLAVNSVIHPLTALLGCPTADIFATPGSVRIANKICQEASAVFGAQIREQAKAWIDAGQGQVGGVLGIARLPPALEAQSLVKQCLQISTDSKGTISSMLDAVRKGRATEIEFLNGYLMKVGKTYGVETPTIQIMYDMMKMRSTVPLDQIP
ncbi:putative 2-dehydropantoate 2-reductase [Mycena venus]|uniref:Putative 2-dehydropantoate 2-reductase n=1 Tax=Mycena venus TaxID=2733690 RepID=A0A8H6XWN8_9AGAR|nr:putative 2-dehydropantoate 2-reductase [Mycena venus]